MVPLDRIKVHLENLRAQKAPIRIHGNGFIQIEQQFTPNNRIHIWSPMIPAQKVYTGIHDHRADFVSAVWYGQIQNRVYGDLVVRERESKPPTDASMRVWQSESMNRFEGDENTELRATSSWIVGGLNPATEVYSAGNAYFFPRYVFHETVVKKLAITGMVRFNQDNNHKSRVLCKVDETPSNEFDKHGFEASQIWTLVFKLINEDLKHISRNYRR